MDESQLSDPKVKIEQEGVGVQFKPQTGLSAWSHGPRSTALVVIFGFAVLFLWIRKDLGWIAYVFVAIAFFAVLWFARAVFHRQDPQPVLMHFASANSTLIFQGFAKNALPQGELVQALVQRVLQLGSVGLPIPTAKFDPATGKTIPFTQTEKDKLLEDQKQFETQVVKEVTQVVQQLDSPN